MFCLSMTAVRYRLVAALSLAFLLSGRVFAYMPQPLPIFPSGPDAKPIPDRKELSVVDETLTGGSNSTGTHSVFIAMRGARVVGKEGKLDEQDVLKEIPAPDFKPTVISPVAPRIFMEQFHKSARGGDYGKAWLAARDAVRSRGATPAEYGAFVLGGLPRER